MVIFGKTLSRTLILRIGVFVILIGMIIIGNNLDHTYAAKETCWVCGSDYYASVGEPSMSCLEGNWEQTSLSNCSNLISPENPGPYTITVMQAAGDYTIATCTTGDDNKIISGTCSASFSSVCRSWSTIRWDGIENSNNQTSFISSYELNNNVFSGNATYYCVSGSSIHEACYVCTDSGKEHIMKWDIDASSTNDCNVFEKDDTINQESCVTKRPACYVCKDEGKEHIMGWGIELNTLDGCNQVEQSTTITEEDLCVTKRPACYVCKDEGKEHIMGWGIDLNTLDGCNQVEQSTTITEEDLCVTKRPACYVCDSDNKIMGWGYSDIEVKNKDTENLCSGNYIKDENIKEDMCITNVQTGQSGIYIIVAGFVGAFIYMIYYYFKHVKKAVN